MSTNKPPPFQPRRNSLKAFFSQLNPKNRPERGGTLRPEIDTNETNGIFYAPHTPQTIPRPSIRRRLVPIPSFGPQHAHAALSNEIIEEAERARKREARRSFRESEDFLGIQGVNPRTGRKDPSEVTTDTVDTRVTFETASVTARCKMEERRKEMEKLKTAYVRAKEMFWEEWEDYRRGKAERREEMRRKTELNRDRKKEKAGQRESRREAKWKLSETGWNSVFSPELTPPVAEMEGIVTQDNYFGDFILRPMSVIPESPAMDIGNVDQNIKFGIMELKVLARRCRRHRRSFK